MRTTKTRLQHLSDHPTWQGKHLERRIEKKLVQIRANRKRMLEATFELSRRRLELYRAKLDLEFMREIKDFQKGEN